MYIVYSVLSCFLHYFCGAKLMHLRLKAKRF